MENEEENHRPRSWGIRVLLETAFRSTNGTVSAILKAPLVWLLQEKAPDSQRPGRETGQVKHQTGPMSGLARVTEWMKSSLSTKLAC